MSENAATNTPPICTEASIQSEFYHWCRVIGLNCCPEFHTPVGRLDAAVFSPGWDRLLAVVECKRPGRHVGRKQLERYKTIGVPVFTLNHFPFAEGLARQLQKLDPAGGVTIEAVDETPRAFRSEIKRMRHEIRMEKKVHRDDERPFKVVRDRWGNIYARKHTGASLDF